MVVRAVGRRRRDLKKTVESNLLEVKKVSVACTPWSEECDKMKNKRKKKNVYKLFTEFV